MTNIKKPYHPLYVANYIITFCHENGLDLNNLKLQKILYYLQAQSLVENDSPLFEESLQKWKYGPVVPSVYHEYKKEGASNISVENISQILRKPDMDEQPNFFGLYVKETFNKDFIFSYDQNILNASIKFLAEYDSFSLVEETHKHSIWKNFEQEINEGVQGLKYSEKEIKEYFINNPEKQLWLS